MKKLSVIIAMAVLPTIGFAQNDNNGKTKKFQDDYSKWSIGVNGGITLMSGDLKSFNGFESTDFDYDINGGLEFAGGLTVTRMVNSWWGFRANSIYGRTSSTRSYGDNSNLSSETFIWNTDLSLVINPLTAFRMWEDAKPRKWGFLVVAGIGLNVSQPALYENNERQYIAVMSDKEYHTPMYLLINPEIKYSLNESLDLDFGARITYHYNSDWIDGVQSGRTNDVLSYVYAGVTFNLGKKGNRTSLVYTAPMSDMYSKVRNIEDKIDMLTKDSDGDGVADYFDKDPDTPEGVAVDGAGRPLDVDMDGIPDYLDADPFTNKGVKVDKDGRELDSDGDGVPDSQDLEPNTPKGALVDVKGRQIDLSKADAVDAFLPQIYFAFNSATVTAANRERLATIARVLQNNENLTMTLVGHTDKVGSEEYNKKLGERRAQAVKDYLVKNFNVDASRLEIKSKGKGQPLGNYNNINRRVETYIK